MESGADAPDHRACGRRTGRVDDSRSDRPPANTSSRADTARSVSEHEWLDRASPWQRPMLAPRPSTVATKGVIVGRLCQGLSLQLRRPFPTTIQTCRLETKARAMSSRPTGFMRDGPLLAFEELTSDREADTLVARSERRCDLLSLVQERTFSQLAPQLHVPVRTRTGSATPGGSTARPDGFFVVFGARRAHGCLPPVTFAIDREYREQEKDRSVRNGPPKPPGSPAQVAKGDHKAAVGRN